MVGVSVSEVEWALLLLLLLFTGVSLPSVKSGVLGVGEDIWSLQRAQGAIDVRELSAKYGLNMLVFRAD